MLFDPGGKTEVKTLVLDLKSNWPQTEVDSEFRRIFESRFSEACKSEVLRSSLAILTITLS